LGYIVPFPEAEKIFTYLQGETQEKLTDMTTFLKVNSLASFLRAQIP